MPKPVDDLSKDPFAEDNLPERQSYAEDVRDVTVDKMKSTAGDYVRQAPKRMGRRLFWGLLLSFSFANHIEKERMLDRLEDGGTVGCYHLMFGSKFSIFGLLRWIIFIGFFGGIAYYAWSTGLIEQFMEQQALIEQFQSTPAP